MQDAQTQLETQLVELQARSEEIEEQLQAKRLESEREQRRKAHLEREINVSRCFELVLVSVSALHNCRVKSKPYRPKRAALPILKAR